MSQTKGVDRPHLDIKLFVSRPTVVEVETSSMEVIGHVDVQALSEQGNSRIGAKHCPE